MQLTFEKFNPATDSEEYLKLLDDNLHVIRGVFLQFFLNVLHSEKRHLAVLLKKSKFVSVKVDGQTAGFIAYTFSEDHTTAFIEHFHLKPPFRGQGIGTRTLEFVET